MHTFNPITWETEDSGGRGRWISEFEASLKYSFSLGQQGQLQRKTLFQRNNQPNKQMSKQISNQPNKMNKRLVTSILKPENHVVCYSSLFFLFFFLFLTFILLFTNHNISIYFYSLFLQRVFYSSGCYCSTIPLNKTNT